MRQRLHLIILILTFGLCVQTSAFDVTPIEPRRELRGVWLTTLSGLDWPKCKARSVAGIEAQKAELLRLLDRLQAIHINTVFFQTRIRGTVLYPSAIEPWDDCLTGRTDGNPGYDPLQFAIEACHERGMELHAWVVAFPGPKLPAAKAQGRKALNKRRPELCMRTQDGWMLNPGEPATWTYLAQICTEIVQRYDVDGISLDYIRYGEKEVQFNDTPTFRRYGKGQTVAAWRRGNVTQCVRTIHRAVKSVKPHVKLSCSPIGKYHDLPRQSSGGWNAYNSGRQEAQAWLREGIMDILAPMIYFKGKQYYPFLFDWTEHRHDGTIAAGLAPYMLETNGWDAETIERECYASRTAGAGQCQFRVDFVLRNVKGYYDFLQRHFYTHPSLPAVTKTDVPPPSPPTGLRVESTAPGGCRLTWTAQEGMRYNVYRSNRYPVAVDTPDNRHLLAASLYADHLDLGVQLPERMLACYAVTAMDRYGQESAPTQLRPEVDAPVAPASHPTPSPVAKSATLCHGQLSLHGDTLVLPRLSAERLLVLDATGRTVQSMPYTATLPLRSLPLGYTVLKAQFAKRPPHTLGTLYRSAY